MGISIVRHLSPEEVTKLQADKEAIEQMSSGVPPGQFVFFAAFDGTNNDKDNVALSKSPHQTNVANLFDQAKPNEGPGFMPQYYPGVGTGGEYGNMLHAGLFPTDPLRATAERAYDDFALEARDYLRKSLTATPCDLSVSTVGFSRGTASQVMFAQMLHERGIVLPDGTQVAPPGSVRVAGMVMIDPVHRFVLGDMSLPANVEGSILVFRAQDENRTDYRLADYSADPRVQTVSLPGNHAGLGGGDDLHGTAAVVLEGSTAYFRNSGVELEPVPAHRRFDPARAVPVYTEAYQIARNGDVISDIETGRPATQWRVDQKKERISEPVRAPVAPEATGPALHDPRHPQSPHHGLFKLLESRLPPETSDDRLLQFTAACHKRRITEKNLGEIYLLGASDTFHIHSSWPPMPGVRIELRGPMPTPEQAAQQIQAFDEQRAMQHAQAQALAQQQAHQGAMVQ